MKTNEAHRRIRSARASRAPVIIVLALALVACQSVPPVSQAPGHYAPGYAESGLKSPPPGIKAIMDETPVALGVSSGMNPFLMDDLASFVIAVPGAESVSLFMGGIADGSPDPLIPYGEQGWFWRSYRSPMERTSSFLLARKAGSPEAGRFEYFSLPHNLPGKPRPELYKDETRAVIVWLPSGYDESPDARFPVIYMQDGQNVFDSLAATHGGWKADTTLTALASAGGTEKAIIVAIPNNQFREAEYAQIGMKSVRDPSWTEETYAEIEFIPAHYRDWSINVLKAEIDRRYRTRPGREDTMVVGSSYGGTLAMYWALSRPEVFGKAAALSYVPHGDMDKSLLTGMSELARSDYLPALAASGAPLPRIWLDCGKKETGLVAFVEAMDGVLRSAGYADGSGYHFEITEGADHNEKFWAERLDRVFAFLLAPKK